MLAGVLAVVVIAVLLLFGVAPQFVFKPGFFIKSCIETLGFHVSNRVGVPSTVLLLWGLIVAVRFAVARIANRASAVNRYACCDMISFVEEIATSCRKSTERKLEPRSRSAVEPREESSREHSAPKSLVKRRTKLPQKSRG